MLAAIVAGRQLQATLLIAKPEQLIRNAGFIPALRDRGVDFVCCDMPGTNTLTVGIFALIVQHARETISQRTKAALAVKRVREELSGAHAKLTPNLIAKSLQVRQANADNHP
ncbi:recombinase family protein [Hymenobacter sp. BT186]|uniref:Recombinase family protein n=1 Tax=Hymenobacter telluris TaxID=2816474 RepID=A0A939F1X8_9BACT|nr:recombinase family protein [Hymenobacter telluris]MBO0360847.1 recombinase family protein [Hymenobacter telluris]MBW3376876.1 recombinase family protein [Hymenobacter norwichensis]